MLTPAFTVSQDEDYIIVVLKCPYVRSQDVEFFIDQTEFKFAIRPYYLKLTFPCAIIEDGRETASYDIGAGEMTIKLPKMNAGEHFPDLDLLSTLVSARQPQQLQAPKKVGIQMLEDSDDESDEEMDSDLVPDWDEPTQLLDQPSLTGSHYGFNNQYSGDGSHVRSLLSDILDVKDIDTSTPSSRRNSRLEVEDSRFDEDYYMQVFADYMDDQIICHLVSRESEYSKIWKQMRYANTNLVDELQRLELDQSTSPTLSTDSNADGTLVNMMASTSLREHPTASLPTPAPSPDRDVKKVDPVESSIVFTPSEQEVMRNLPKKPYLIEDSKQLYLGLVDILYAYCLDSRITEGEHTRESAILIGKLSSSFSCFEVFTTAQEVLTACYRRSLIFPLHRNFALSVAAHRDVTILLNIGKRAILKVLISLKLMMDHDDRAYMLCRLWVDDYAVWVQSCSDHVLASLASKLGSIQIEKGDLGWNLEAYERLALESEEGFDEEADEFEAEE
ncbi:hypothetical protein SmJEL517_g00812 [Synchytrium microbalum]|uniref:CS domain-containing protein n=1 Tax=Synchytrium microbalum TaxID=1806994 RepID=A0A507CGM3_9FUNG|nr:uncharacterized protein SmJEL517_g00812 [Synchytrium microbalum]TPX37196.1 hypothetical protein SmJEL517_g00812 [Synchytrium microbalum]